MFKQSSIGLRYLLIAVTIGFAVALIRSELIIYYLQPAMVNVVRVTAYTSAFVTAMFSFILILFAFYILFLICKKDETVTAGFTYGIQYFSIVLIAGEALKLFLIFLLLKGGLQFVNGNNISASLQRTTWYRVQNILNVATLAGGVVVFTIVVKERSKEAFSFNQYARLAIPLLLLLVFASVVHF